MNRPGKTMRNIDFSMMLQNSSSANEEAFFYNFVTNRRIEVNRIHIEWADSWNRLLKFGLNTQGRGPDLSEVGTTWLGGFHAMEALRPFIDQEIDLVGGRNKFLPAAWQSCVVEPGKTVVGVPWTLDIRVLVYRRDWLQKAGVEESTAFSDAEYFRDTLRCLQAAGHPAPLGITTAHTVTRMLHDMASWVWDAGGEIRSRDGQKMLLRSFRSLAGLEAYFGLNEFLVPETRGQEQPEVFDSFLAGKTAVAVVSDLNYHTLRKSAASEVTENLGMATLMKVPFVGGTALAIWQYSTHIDEALKLIEYLTNIEAGQILYEEYLTTPANLDALEKSALKDDPYYPVIRKSLQTGRSFPTGHRWGGVESRLVLVIEQLWRDLQADPQLNIKREVKKRFTEFCDRLESTFLAPYA